MAVGEYWNGKQCKAEGGHSLSSCLNGDVLFSLLNGPMNRNCFPVTMASFYHIYEVKYEELFVETSHFSLVKLCVLLGSILSMML